MWKKTNRILIVILIAALASSFALAEGSEPSTGSFLGLTALTPALISPLAKLDLLPLTTPSRAVISIAQPRHMGSPVLDLNPRSLIAPYTPSYLGRGARFSSVGDKLFTISIFSAIGLQAADYFSTMEALKRPGLQEGNSMMKTIVKSPAAFAAVKIGICAATFFGLKNLYKSSKPLAWFLSAATNFAMSYVVSNNMRLIASHPRAR